MDLKKLEELQAKTRFQELTGVAGMLHSLHRDPALQDWVTMESRVLAPVPGRRGEQWVFVALLAIPAILQDGKPGFAAPWGAIVWNIKDLKVLETIDLRTLPMTNAFRALGPISAAPADASAAAQTEVREKMLFAKLDALSVSADKQIPSGLASDYAGLLPAAAYPFYWELLPDSRFWLLPNVPASTLGGVESVAAGATHAVVKQPEAPTLQPTPADLTPRLAEWSRKLGQLGKDANLPIVAESVLQANQYLATPGFRLAMAGECSTGKSTLLNRLLGISLLPTGHLPTTMIPFLISSGDTETLSAVYADGRRESRTLEPMAWDELFSQSRGAAPTIGRITLNNPWLRTIDAELLDTPGVGNARSKTETRENALAKCDAVVMVISATRPFALSEVAFLENEVMKKHIPKVCIVVSQLDQIEADKREEAFAYIQTRAGAIAPGIPVLASRGIGKQTDDAALETIRAHISFMTKASDRQVWRSHQVAGMLLDTAQMAACYLKEASAATQMGEKERQEGIAKARQSIQTGELIWEQIRLELNTRRQRCIESVGKHVEKAAEDLMDSLRYDLSRTGDPKAWWERDLPYRLRREFIAISRRLEDYIVRTVSSDLAWVQQTVRERFGADYALTSKTWNKTETSVAPLTQAQVADTNKYRLFSRIGVGLSSFVGILLFPGVGIAIATGVGVANEAAIMQKIEHQKELLRPELDRALERTVQNFIDEFSRRLSDFYAHLLQEIREPQARWSKARLSALEKPPSADPVVAKRLAEDLDGANTLAEEIRQAIAQARHVSA